MTAVKVILLATAGWHALAVWHFTLFPARTLARTTRERPVAAIPTELFRFLGAMNLPCVLLAAGAALAGLEARRLALACLVVANLGQAALDLRVHRLGLAQGPFFRAIFAGDLLFAALSGLGLALDGPGGP